MIQKEHIVHSLLAVFPFSSRKKKVNYSQRNTAGLRFDRDKNGIPVKMEDFWECTERFSDIKVKPVEVKGMERHI